MTNHLWQSTVFAACVALLAWILRNHRASVRYALWFSASVKFLIPFALFMSLGRHAEPAVAPLTPAIAAAARQFTIPFPESIQVGGAPEPIHWMPWVLAAWACGVLSIVTMRVRAWLRVHRIARGSRRHAMPFPIEVRTSSALLEPGLIGLWRCTLLLPEGIERYLTPRQMDGVLIHELCHAERRDNLLAVVHMAVETLFWFHPLVWWIGARLAETRESCCDEAVLAHGGNASDYAEAILNVCKRYVESPLACVSGMTGADLKKRIEAILSRRMTLPLDWSKRTLLAAAALIAVLIPFIAGVTSAQSSKSFEVASVRLDPNARRITTSGVGHPPRLVGDRFEYTGTAYSLIVRAFSLTRCQDPDCVLGGPSWIRDDMYRIDAKLPEGVARYSTWEFNRGEAEGVYQMLQSLLAERFSLKVHRETKQVPVYAMTVAKGGHKLTATAGRMFETDDGTTRLDQRMEIIPLGGWEAGMFRMTVTNFTLQKIADNLPLDRPVLDRTGLSGRFDFTLEWQTDEPGFPPKPGGPGLISALAKQLGLRLEPTKGPVDVVAIDRIERPTDN